MVNQQFTPITNKALKPLDTPYHPIHLGDLSTPISNKSNSNEDQETINISKEEELTSDYNELKNTLLHAISIIDKLSSTKKSSPLKYRSVQTQTAIENSLQKQSPLSPSETTEITFDDSSDSMIITKKTENQDDSFDVSCLGDMTTPKSQEKSYFSSTESSNERIEEKALQDRMHDLSLLLKRLENQLDEMNQSDSY
ncbi:uncharacterized protein GO595_007370 [Histomonas meleagridis]|uniref:uncharacterized protein n=1 Tax=Histomonas meleagridis TaxID=135588 RepID=UPI00355AB98B|nr:hypothetical protein GO595_007370 [Histomonas meleagridis]